MGLASRLSPLARLFTFWKILRDKSVPWWGKLGFIAASLGYAINPADLIPDVVLGIGWLDDLIVLPVFAWFFGKKLPSWLRRQEPTQTPDRN